MKLKLQTELSTEIRTDKILRIQEIIEKLQSGLWENISCILKILLCNESSNK